MAQNDLSLHHGFVLRKENIVVVWNEKNPLQTIEGDEETLIETSFKNLLILFAKLRATTNRTNPTQELAFLKNKYKLEIKKLK